jgi:hypothetical protein
MRVIYKEICSAVRTQTYAFLISIMTLIVVILYCNCDTDKEDEPAALRAHVCTSLVQVGPCYHTLSIRDHSTNKQYTNYNYRR